MRKARAPVVQVCVKIDKAQVARLDRLVPQLTASMGREAGRADVLRRVIVLGLAELEKSSGR